MGVSIATYMVEIEFCMEVMRFWMEIKMDEMEVMEKNAV